MIIDITQTKIERQISARKEADEVFDFVLTTLHAGKIPTCVMFEERGWDYDRYVHKMIPMITCSHP